ncbi:MAG: NCS2 family permease [Lachnospiraceae bacterium]|nr:NCS2 family permease [Lachnospiraceae bacterium]
MDKFFKFKESGTNYRTETVAGITTFFTMAYIIFVNPGILSASGMSWDGVFVATIIATVVGTLIMGLVANVPYAVAPGMGLNAFFTYTVCFGLGFVWQEALAMVFICGLINILITVTKIRKVIIKAIPRSLQLAIGGSIGLFIAYIGLKNAGFLVYGVTSEGVTAGVDIVPELAHFNDRGAIVALIGLFIIIILMFMKVKAAMLIGIIAATIVAIPLGVVSLPPANELFSNRMGAVGDVAFSIFGNPGFGSLFSDSSKILPALLVIFAFSLTDTFDTVGTFIGTGRKTGIFDDKDEKALSESSGFKSKMDKALFADAIATSIGALAGTSNTTTYIESASGINVGGRTGFTSVVTAGMFLLCLPFAALFGIVPAQATAPALIVVGILMADSFAGIKWGELEEAAPAFLTVLIMAFAYNISYGIAAGFIFYCVAKIVKGKAKDVHPVIYVSTALFVINFIVLALGII